uniref:GPI inositol-deacylase n=1 Tax=Timema cristinae TaxID=61476 RepID=A0A7R9D7G2_TIMCR|nr:unnamed protein product [Timema cristinae]
MDNVHLLPTSWSDSPDIDCVCKISLPPDVLDDYPRYGLYAYGEGQHTEKLRKMSFSGIPVLFIPGNSGSYKQVRSLASVSLRKAISAHTPYHFDYFSVDLNDEYSALFGGVLKEQTEFVHLGIKRIQELYNNGSVPRSVVLVGHSMGGMVAKGLFLQPAFNSRLVNVIITLATPHKQPVLALDPHIVAYYRRVNAFWEAERSSPGGAVRHVTFVSIGGGHRDLLVRSGLTYAKEADVNVLAWSRRYYRSRLDCRRRGDHGSIPVRCIGGAFSSLSTLHSLHTSVESNSKKVSELKAWLINSTDLVYTFQDSRFKASIGVCDWRELRKHYPYGSKQSLPRVMLQSTAVPAVWLSTDHLCAVWCKELVMVLASGLFDIVDVTTKQISANATLRREVFHYHLMHRTASKRLTASFHPPVIPVNPRGDWREGLDRQLTVKESHGVKSPLYQMIRLLDDPKHARLVVEAINVENKDWVFACTASSVYGNVRMCESGVNLSNQSTISPSRRYRRKMIGLDLEVLRLQTFTHVVLQVLPTSEPFQLNVDVHSVARQLTFPAPRWLLFPSRHVILPSTDEGAVHYKITLTGFEHSWQAFRLYVEPLACKRALHHAVALFKVPWRREDMLAYITQAPISSFVELTLDPACRYSVSLEFSVVDSLGQLVRFYCPMLWSYVVVILILTVRRQLRSAEDTGVCVMFHSALATGARPYYVLPAVKILAHLVGSVAGSELVGRKGQFLIPDAILLREDGQDFLLLPVILYCVAFFMVYLLGLGCWASVISSGHATHKMAIRFLAKTVTGTVTISEWFLSGLGKLPSAVAAFLVALCYSTCGALSLGVGTTFFFLKLCKMYDDYLEELFKISIQFLLKKKRGRNESKKETDQDNGDKEGAKQTEPEEDREKDETEVGSSESGPAPSSTTDKPEDGPASRTDLGSAVVSAPSPSRTRSGEDTSKTVMSRHEGYEDSTLSQLHFNFTLLLLWLAGTVVHIPCVLVWAHNFRYNTKLTPDPSFLSGVVMCSCAGILWQGNFPRTNLKNHWFVDGLLYSLSVLILVYTPVSLYRVGPAVAVAFFIVTIHQVFSPKAAPRQERQD